MGNIRRLVGVFNRNGKNVSVAVHVQERVFVRVFRFGVHGCPELYVEGIGLLMDKTQLEPEGTGAQMQAAANPVPHQRLGEYDARAGRDGRTFRPEPGNKNQVEHDVEHHGDAEPDHAAPFVAGHVEDDADGTDCDSGKLRTGKYLQGPGRGREARAEEVVKQPPCGGDEQNRERKRGDQNAAGGSGNQALKTHLIARVIKARNARGQRHVGGLGDKEHERRRTCGDGVEAGIVRASQRADQDQIHPVVQEVQPAQPHEGKRCTDADFDVRQYFRTRCGPAKLEFVHNQHQEGRAQHAGDELDRIEPTAPGPQDCKHHQHERRAGYQARPLAARHPTAGPKQISAHGAQAAQKREQRRYDEQPARLGGLGHKICAGHEHSRGEPGKKHTPVGPVAHPANACGPLRAFAQQVAGQTHADQNGEQGSPGDDVGVQSVAVRAERAGVDQARAEGDERRTYLESGGEPGRAHQLAALRIGSQIITQNMEQAARTHPGHRAELGVIIAAQVPGPARGSG